MKKIILIITPWVFIFSLFSTSAHAECKQFPKYPLWKNLTHERAAQYVQRKLKGDWTPYIKHLQKQIKSLDHIIETGKRAKLRHKGKVIVLSGDELGEYYTASKQRLDVVECLSEEAFAVGLDAFATAAGGEAPVREVKVAPEVSSVSAVALRIDVSASCEDGVSRFKIKNKGADWPKSGMFSIYRIDGAQKNTVSSRRMRLKTGQVASFKVKRSRNPTGHLGLFVGPQWYARPFIYDATLRCN